jgi:hypothetical protein
MRNPVFKILAAALHKAKRLVKNCKINLGANPYFTTVKYAETAADTLFHKLPASTPIAVAGEVTTRPMLASV